MSETITMLAVSTLVAMLVVARTVIWMRGIDRELRDIRRESEWLRAELEDKLLGSKEMFRVVNETENRCSDLCSGGCGCCQPWKEHRTQPLPVAIARIKEPPWSRPVPMPMPGPLERRR